MDYTQDGGSLSGSDTESAYLESPRMSVIEMWRKRENEALQRQSAINGGKSRSTQIKESTKQVVVHKATTARARDSPSSFVYAPLSQSMSDATNVTADSSPPYQAGDSSKSSIHANCNYAGAELHKTATRHLSPLALPVQRIHTAVVLESHSHLHEEKELNQIDGGKQTINVQESPQIIARNRRASILDVWTLREKAVISPSQTTRRSPASVASNFFDTESEEFHGSSKVADQNELSTPPPCQTSPVSPRRSLSVLDRWNKGLIHTDDFSSSQEASPRANREDESPYDDVTNAVAAQTVFNPQDHLRQVLGQDQYVNASTTLDNKPKRRELNHGKVSRSHVIASIERCPAEETSIIHGHGEGSLLLGHQTQPYMSKSRIHSDRKVVEEKAYEQDPQRLATSKAGNCPLQHEESSVREPAFSAYSSNQRIDHSSSVRRNLDLSFSAAEVHNQKPHAACRNTRKSTGASPLEGQILDPIEEIHGGTTLIEKSNQCTSSHVWTTENIAGKKNHVPKIGSSQCYDSLPKGASHGLLIMPQKRSVVQRWKARSQEKAARRAQPTTSASVSAHRITSDFLISDEEKVCHIIPKVGCRLKGNAIQQKGGELDQDASPGAGKIPNEDEESQPESYQPKIENHGSMLAGNPTNKHTAKKPSLPSPNSEDSICLDFIQGEILSSRSDLSAAGTYKSMTAPVSSDLRMTGHQASVAVLKKAATYEQEAVRLTNSFMQDVAPKRNDLKIDGHGPSSKQDVRHRSEVKDEENNMKFQSFRSALLASHKPQVSTDSNASGYLPPWKCNKKSIVHSSPQTEVLNFSRSNLSNSSYSNAEVQVAKLDKREASTSMPKPSLEKKSLSTSASGSLVSKQELQCLEAKITGVCKTDYEGGSNDGIEKDDDTTFRIQKDNDNVPPTQGQTPHLIASRIENGPIEKRGCGLDKMQPPSTTGANGNAEVEDAATVVDSTSGMNKQTNHVGYQRLKNRHAFYMKRSKVRLHRRLVERKSASCSVMPMSATSKPPSEVEHISKVHAPTRTKPHQKQRGCVSSQNGFTYLTQATAHLVDEPATAAENEVCPHAASSKHDNVCSATPTTAQAQPMDKSEESSVRLQCLDLETPKSPPSLPSNKASLTDGGHNVSCCMMPISPMPPQENEKCAQYCMPYSATHASAAVSPHLGAPLDNRCSRSEPPLSAPAQLIDTTNEDARKQENSRFLSCAKNHVVNKTCVDPKQLSSQEIAKMHSNEVLASGTRLRQGALLPSPCATYPRETAVSEAGCSDGLSFFSHAGSAFSGYSGRSSLRLQHAETAALQSCGQSADIQSQLHVHNRTGTVLAHPLRDSNHPKCSRGIGVLRPVPLPQTSIGSQSRYDTSIGSQRSGLASRYDTPSRFLDGEVEVEAENSTVCSTAQSSAANSTFASDTSQSFDSGLSEGDVYTTIDEESHPPPKDCRRRRRRYHKSKGVLQEGLSHAFQDAYQKLSDNVAGSVMNIDLQQFTSGLNDGVQKASESLRKFVDSNTKACEENGCKQNGRLQRANIRRRDRTDESTADEGIAIEVEYVSDSEEDEDSEQYVPPSSASNIVVDKKLMSMTQTAARRNNACSDQPPGAVSLSQEEATLSGSNSSLLFMGQIKLGSLDDHTLAHSSTTDRCEI